MHSIIIISFLLLILFHSLFANFHSNLETLTVSNQCLELPESSSFSMACSGAVDYKFFLPSGVTLGKFSRPFFPFTTITTTVFFHLDVLNSLAVSQLNKSELSILPTECQKSIKKMVCSNVYRRCPTNIVLSDTKTYNFMIYSDIQVNLTKVSTSHPEILASPAVSLPFQRPCKTVCTNVLSKCGSFLGLLGSAPDCSSRMDYSGGALAPLYRAFPNLLQPFQYDQSSNVSVCNAMKTSFEVQSTKEPYLLANDPKGFCYGIVKELFVPPGPQVDTSLAPMQAPYVIQTVIENKLSGMGAVLPVWLSKECKIAIRKYFCGSYMVAPDKQNIGEALTRSGYGALLGAFPPEITSYSFYMPSFPHRSVCKDYARACGEFIAMANLPPLTPNCNSNSKGVYSYPTGNQTIQSLTIPQFKMHVNFTTSPNRMLSVVTEGEKYETICPEGYVVPDAVDPRTAWIPGSGCALACRVPVWTAVEKKSFDLEAKIVTWIGFPLVLFLLLTWTLDSSKRKQYLVICFALSSLLATITQVLSTINPFEKFHCATNAVPRDETDGVNMCSAQALAMVFAANAITASWMLLSVDIFLKIVMGWRSTHQLRPYFLAFILIEPTICCAVASTLKYGFVNIIPVCFMNQPYDGGVYNGPAGIMTIVGLLAMVAVVSNIVMSILYSSANSTSSITDKLQMIRTPVIFITFFLIFSVTEISFVLEIMRLSDRVEQSLQEFTMCVFTNFDGSDSSWKSVCGSHPSDRFNHTTTQWVFFCMTGQSILVSLTYLLSPSVWRFWMKIIGIEQSNFLSQMVQTGKSLRGKKVYTENGSRVENKGIVVNIKEKDINM